MNDFDVHVDPFQITIVARRREGEPNQYGWGCRLCMNHVLRDLDPDKIHGGALAHLIIHHNIYAGFMKPSVIKEA